MLGVLRVVVSTVASAINNAGTCYGHAVDTLKVCEAGGMSCVRMSCWAVVNGGKGFTVRTSYTGYSKNVDTRQWSAVEEVNRGARRLLQDAVSRATSFREPMRAVLKRWSMVSITTVCVHVQQCCLQM